MIAALSSGFDVLVPGLLLAEIGPVVGPGLRFFARGGLNFFCFVGKPVEELLEEIPFDIAGDCVPGGRRIPRAGGPCDLGGGTYIEGRNVFIGSETRSFFTFAGGFADTGG